MTVRPAVPEDAEAIVALRERVYPFLVRGVESVRRIIVAPQPDEKRVSLVAQSAGQVVGWAGAYRNVTSPWPDVGEISLLSVHPDHRGQGFGSALFTSAKAHLIQTGARRLRAWALAESVGFAQRQGFEPGAQARFSKLDLQPSAEPSPPPGIRLLALRDVDHHALYRAHAAAAADEPGDVPSTPLSYETWRYLLWDGPALDKQISTAAMSGPDVVSFSVVSRAGDRIWSDMTATLPEHRGRGLALLTKSMTLHLAGRHGVRSAYTANDETNAGMLAVNTRLGYRLIGTQFSCLATVAP